MWNQPHDICLKQEEDTFMNFFTTGRRVNCSFCPAYPLCERSFYEVTRTDSKILNPHGWCCKTSYPKIFLRPQTDLFSANPQNRDDLGVRIDLNTRKVSLVNEFVSSILFPSGDSVDQEISLCLEKLPGVSFVTMKMSRHDSVVMTTYEEELFVQSLSGIGTKVN